MKRILTFFVLVAIAASIQVAAQDITQSRPQLFSVELGVPLGFVFDNGNEEAEAVAGSYVALTFPAIDKLTFGVDALTLAGENYGSGTPVTFSGIKLGYNFTDQIGAVLGFGATGATGAIVSPYIKLGASYAFTQARSSVGLAYGFNLGLQYVAPTEDIAKGAVAFIVSTSLGL